MKVPTFLFSRSNGRSGKLLRKQSKTTPIQPKFSLEQLEPRLLLSATTGAEDELSSLISSNSYQDELYNPLAIVVETSESQADGTDNEQFVQPIETELCNDLLPEPIIQIDLDPSDSESNPVESLNNDFMPGVDLQGDNAESTAINLPKGVGDLGTDWDLLIPETNVFPSNSTSDFEDLSSDKADSDNDNSSTEQLIETLLAANPPPALTVSGSPDMDKLGNAVHGFLAKRSLNSKMPQVLTRGCLLITD